MKSISELRDTVSALRPAPPVVRVPEGAKPPAGDAPPGPAGGFFD